MEPATLSESSVPAPGTAPAAVPRKVYCVLSARSLPYAEKAMESLFAHALEPVSLTLITDDDQDRIAIEQVLARLDIPSRHQHRVCTKQFVDELAVTRMSALPHLAAFRNGHPCWRKITDPLLFASDDEELIVLDPDLYFPNHFRFEPTLASGIQLMHQPPSCLLPESVVLRAYERGIRLAHHVDIGVAQLRNNLDLGWIDWLIGELGGQSLPRAMHVEAIVWAAMAMRFGGTHLDPVLWHCWQNRQWKRLALKLGVPGTTILRSEDFGSMKCFHAGGQAKWFVRDACDRRLFPAPREIAVASGEIPYVELTAQAYAANQRLKRVARSLGYYRLFGSSS